MKRKERRSYFLFIHYGIKGDLENNKEKLSADLAYLEQILTPKAADQWQGHAFVYIDHGFRELVRRSISTPDVFDLADKLKDFLVDIRKVPKNVTLISVFELKNLIKEIEKDLPTQLKNKLYNYMVSRADKTYYDGPKIVEAILRIANIGRSTPIFRFDDDVIFYGSRRKTNNKKQTESTDRTRSQILGLCKHYDTLCQDPEINYFIFSGGYCNTSFNKKVSNLQNKFSARNLSPLLNGFATRVVQLAEINDAYEELEKSKLPPSNKYDSALTNIKAKFETSKITEFLNDLSKIGANPFRQVISGAGFCLSDGAILDLPPYSNMRQNVMWIDDHLKYSLHHELRHFGFKRGTRQIAKLKNIYFNQFRHLPGTPPTLKDVRWHVREYLPRLILGCIADSWLRESHLLKESFNKLGDEEIDKLFDNVPGKYARRFIKNASSGEISKSERSEYKKELWQIAYKRLEDIINTLGNDKYNGTFLKLFIEGPGEESLHGPAWKESGFFTDFAPNGLRKELKKIPRDYNEKHKIPAKCSGHMSLEISIKILIEDFINYGEFTWLWRHFIFCVRSLLNWEKTMPKNIDWLLPGILHD